MRNDVQYVVKDEHTLGYIYDAQPSWMGILAGSVLKGGHDSLGGPVHILAGYDKLRPATEQDFREFRVVPPSGFAGKRPVQPQSASRCQACGAES